jgi:frataxin-like iron-binding protein CyaY
MNVRQLRAELDEYDQEAPVKVQGEGDIIDIETTDTNIILISGDYDGVE